jgi:hypothetical protein
MSFMAHVDGGVVAGGTILHFAWQFDEVGLGVEHRLVLPLQAGLDEPVDGLEGERFPGVPELAAMDGELAIQQPIDQREARVLCGVRLLREQVIELGQHVAHVEGLQGPPAAFLVVGGDMIDIKIRGIGKVTS